MKRVITIRVEVNAKKNHIEEAVRTALTFAVEPVASALPKYKSHSGKGSTVGELGRTDYNWRVDSI